MYAIAIIRYRRPLDEVIAVQDAHRAYTAELKAAGTIVASGPLVPRYGGAMLLHVDDADGDAALERVRDGDPYVRAGVAQYELLPWAPTTGREALDRLTGAVPPDVPAF